MRRLSDAANGAAGRSLRAGTAVFVCEVLGLLMLGSGCGYRQGSLYPAQIQSVAVPVFGNASFERGMELSLTKAVVNRLETLSPYKVAGRESADAILEGEIVGVRLRTLSRDYQTNLPREQQMVVSVNFVLKDLRSGQILVQRRGVEVGEVYYPTLGEARFVGNQEVVEKLALAIVQNLQADW